jgi:predicted nucleic acid-binding protein
MIVVADTTPLNYLILIGHSDILPKLYGRVLIPQAVYDELQRPRTPEVVRAAVAALPPWLEVRRVDRPPDSSLENLDSGEQEAFLLAEDLKADLLMLDDRDARQIAAARHLPVIGTLGVLEEAAKASLLDLASALSKLKQTTFRADAKLLTALLERDAQRTHPGREPEDYPSR